MNPFRIQTLLLSFFGFLLSCKQQQEPASETMSSSRQDGLIHLTARQFEENQMRLGKVEKRAFPEVIRVSGTIDVPPENRVVISAVYGGYVKKTTLLEGDRVRKGQQVIILENPDFLSLQQEYLEVSEQLPYLEADFERQKTLYGEKISSEKVYLRAQSDYKMALARKSSLKGQLEMLDIPTREVEGGKLQTEIALRAPISGNVNRIGVRTGAFVSPATEIMEIVNTDHIHLEFLVFEKDISSIREGQEIRFRVPEVSAKMMEGSVYLIGSTIDENRTVKVHGHVEEGATDGLMVGMFVQAEILILQEGVKQETWALPETAVMQGVDGAFVYVVVDADDSNYSFRKVPVNPGITASGFIAITDLGSLEATDQVLTDAALLLNEPYDMED
jgi:cobalt-zinc-cadmium efflux system membrane fusion protein